LRKSVVPAFTWAKTKVRVAAIYNCERHDRRVKTLIRLAEALGLKLGVLDLRAVCEQRGPTVAKLALISEFAFDTVTAWSAGKRQRAISDCPGVRGDEALAPV
jgi:hypothetical protein